MRIPNFRLAALALATGAALGGCATYSPYGYGSGVSVSVGSGYGSYGYGRYGYYDPFEDPYYMGYRSAYGSRFGGWYGSPYGGWYNNYYYPGTGIYIYDRYRKRHTWNNAMRNYWSSRRARLEASGVTNPAVTRGGTTVRPPQAVQERPTRTRTPRVTRVERSTRAASAERARTTQAAERARATQAERRAERAAERAARRAARDDD